MPHDIEYITHYLGPVFFVNKRSFQYTTLTRKVESCPNEACKEHQKPVHGMPLHCTACGSKISLVLCSKKIEDTPACFVDDFYKKCFGVSNRAFNGTDSFMEDNVTFFNNDNELVYVPIFEKSQLKYSIQRDNTLGKFCIKESCRCHKKYTHTEYDYCPECGSKLWLNKTESVTGHFSKETMVVLDKHHDTGRFDLIEFLDEPELNKLVVDYKKSKDCKSIIADIEKAYGKGCVTMKLAFVSYHSIY